MDGQSRRPHRLHHQRSRDCFVRPIPDQPTYRQPWPIRDVEHVLSTVHFEKCLNLWWFGEHRQLIKNAHGCWQRRRICNEQKLLECLWRLPFKTAGLLRREMAIGRKDLHRITRLRMQRPTRRRPGLTVQNKINIDFALLRA
jgi:hypothetical protein